MKTAVVEKDRVGGRCLNYACIPAKAVLRAADVKTEVEDAGSFGIEVEGTSVDFSGVAAHREKVVKTLTSGVSFLFDKNKIELIEGHGALTDDASVRIGAQKDGEEIEAEKVVIAVGSVPKPVLGLKFGGRVLGTETAWALDELPGCLAVIGAGAGPALANKASDEGVIAVEDAAGKETQPIDYRFVPAATFCHPQVASFGMTEKEARDAGRDVVVGKVPVGAVGAPTVYGAPTGMIKIVGDAEYGELLGGHIVCVKAADLSQEL